MQHIDPELFTWLFIGAVGLVAGVWGLTRAASRRRGEAELSRLGKTSAAAPAHCCSPSGCAEGR